MWKCGLDSAGSGQWEMVVSCEHGKEPLVGLHKMQGIWFEWNPVSYSKAVWVPCN